MHFGMVEWLALFTGHCDLKLDLLPSFQNNHVRRSLISYAVGILNLVCECIFKWRSVRSHFWVTVTFTFGLVSRIGIESGAYLLYSLM